MSEMKPAGWRYEVKVPETNIWINAATAYEPIAETDRRRNVQLLYTAEQLAEAVAAEREKNDALIRSLAVGYERMRGVLCKMAATSGPDTSWYRHQATQGMDSVPGIWDIAKIPVEAEPGECSWINRDGSLEAIRSAAK